MVNQLLGNRYEIQQQLAKKAGRQTLLARDVLNDELVVIKLLNFSDDFEWDDLKLFEREAETLKALAHPAIPRYLDYLDLGAGERKGFALVQTHVVGKSLEEYLQLGRTFSEAELKEIASQLLQILGYLHSRQPNVIHRDIKPSNILLGERSGNSVGQVYLVDFGSVYIRAATRGGTITVVGTYGYMPPEQFGDRAVPASDLYSLGATLIAVITGSHPADLPQKDGRIQFEHIANITPAFTEWLKWLTEPSLDKRLSKAELALSALANPQINITITPPKPKGSRIRLTKTRDSLKIFLGRGRLGNVVTGIFIATFLLYIGMLLMPFVSSSPFPWNIIIKVILSGVSVTTGLGLFVMIIFTLSNTQIEIDRQKFTVNKNLGGIKSTSLTSPVDSITKLVYTPRYLRATGEGSVEEQSKLIIWLGARQYEIGGNFSFISDPEIEWLAAELSNWLNIPITIVSPKYVASSSVCKP
jgi:serine/threonine protein kinase